jgi:hypothetical protein
MYGSFVLFADLESVRGGGGFQNRVPASCSATDEIAMAGATGSTTGKAFHAQMAASRIAAIPM